jgi:hypothetical protein
MAKSLSNTALFVLLAVVLTVSGCSREQYSAAVNNAAKSYNLSSRDGVIRNWQAKVSKEPRCQAFSERFKVAGERYDGAANGSFAMDMMKIWEDTKSSQCAAPV